MRTLSKVISILFVIITGISCTQQPSEPFPIIGWNGWGNLTIENNPTTQNVSFSGIFLGAAAGYVIESNIPFAKKTLSLKISNSNNSELDKNKLFKFEVNGIPLKPEEQSRINLNDNDYINSGDGVVTFKLPSKISKLQFVFWNAKLDKLTLSGSLN